MTTTLPLDIFSPELMPGESILWTGQPNPWVMFYREDWKAIPFSLMFGAVTFYLFLAMSGLFAPANANHLPLISAVILGGPFMLMGQYYLWGRFVYARWRKKHIYYALTNQRVLILEYRFGKRDVSVVLLEAVTVIERRIRSDGNGSISFGGPIGDDFRLVLRSNNYIRINDQTPKYPTLYDVDDAESLYQAIEQARAEAYKTAGDDVSRW